MSQFVTECLPIPVTGGSLNKTSPDFILWGSAEFNTHPTKTNSSGVLDCFLLEPEVRILIHFSNPTLKISFNNSLSFTEQSCESGRF